MIQALKTRYQQQRVDGNSNGCHLIPEKIALHQGIRENLAREIDIRALRKSSKQGAPREEQAPMGGLDLLHFNGEGRNLQPMVRQPLLCKGGMPVESEDLIDRERHITDNGRRLKEGLEWISAAPSDDPEFDDLSVELQSAALDCLAIRGGIIVASPAPGKDGRWQWVDMRESGPYRKYSAARLKKWKIL